jgi:hypothetical protein
MSKFVGRLVKVGIAREATRGTEVAPSILVPFDSFSFDDKVVQPRSTAGLGVLDDSDGSFVVTKYGEGELGGELRDQSIGYFLYSLLGTCASAGVVDSSYTHTFSVLHTVTHPTLSMRVSDANTTEMYAMNLLKELELTAALNEVVKVRAGFIGKHGRFWGNSTLNATNENRFTKKHIVLKVAATRATLAAATALSVKSVRVTFNQNAVIDDVLGTATPEDVLNGPLSIEGEITLNYTDETWKNYMRDASTKAMSLAFTNTDAVIGAATRPSLTFIFPKVDFFDWKPNYSLGEVVTQGISFKAIRDVANNEDNVYSATLVNAKQNYTA